MKAPELQTLLQREGYNLSETECRALISAARTFKRVAVDECNLNPSGPGNAARLALNASAERRHLSRVKAIAKRHGLRLVPLQDARGYGLHVVLPSGRYNTMGGPEQGWGI